MIINKKIENLPSRGFNVKSKREEKKSKKIDKARELQKLWNIGVTVIPIVVGALGIVIKVLERELEELKSEEKLRPSR